MNDEELDWKLHYISVERLRDFYEQLKDKLHTVQDMPDLGKLLVTIHNDVTGNDDKFLVDREVFEAPNTPTMTASGTWDYSHDINISTDTEGAVIKYTINGGSPVTTTESSVTVTLSQDTSTEVKMYSVTAVSVKNGLESDPITRVYNINRRVATPTLSPAAGTYNTTKSVTISCGTTGATIYYTTDGSTPTTSSSVYSSAISVTQTTTIKALAVKSEWVNSLVGSATYTLKVVDPTITVSGDEYDTSRTITLACTDSAATIYYKYGSGSWTQYTTALTISDTKHIYVESRRSGWTSGTADLNITVGTKYTHAGLSDLSNVDGSTAATLLPTLTVTEQGGVKKPSPAGKYTFTTTTSAKYIWFAVPRNYSITEVANGAVPQQFTMKYDDTTGGYKYYRMDGQMIANQSITLTVTA